MLSLPALIVLSVCHLVGQPVKYDALFSNRRNLNPALCCFNADTLGSSPVQLLRGGRSDIIVSQGHIVNEVPQQEDPAGLYAILRASDCSSYHLSHCLPCRPEDHRLAIRGQGLRRREQEG